MLNQIALTAGRQVGTVDGGADDSWLGQPAGFAHLADQASRVFLMPTARTTSRTVAGYRHRLRRRPFAMGSTGRKLIGVRSRSSASRVGTANSRGADFAS